ncbi:MAG: redoxin domain-containing protein [Chloroflexota bacterium]|nr:redoxin domain-containing protein [Chloroflexota bacterium]
MGKQWVSILGLIGVLLGLSACGGMVPAGQSPIDRVSGTPVVVREDDVAADGPGPTERTVAIVPTVTPLPTVSPTTLVLETPLQASATSGPASDAGPLSDVGAGMEVPDVILQAVTGEAVQLRDLRGKSVVLAFFGTTCAPCKDELLVLQQLQAQYGDALEVVLVGAFEDGESVQAYAQELGLSDVRLVADDVGEAAFTYEVMTIPTTFFINRAGAIVGREDGAVGRTGLALGLARVGLGQVSAEEQMAPPEGTETERLGCPLGGC